MKKRGTVLAKAFSKNITMNYLFSLFAAVLLFSCAAQKKSSSPYAEIQYEAGPCFGFCPYYTMTIKADRTAVLEAEHFNFSEGGSKEDFSKPREGTFTATIKKENYDELVNLLNALNVKALNDKYGDKRIMDASTSYLRITFSDGEKKQIQDYGKHGTEGLVELYQYFESLKKSQDWTKIK